MEWLNPQYGTNTQLVKIFPAARFIATFTEAHHQTLF
jgi:hypothetical protein